jgi:hypothetical protein
MRRTRGKSATTPAAETQPAVAVVPPDKSVRVEFTREHFHDGEPRTKGERAWVSPASAALLGHVCAAYPVKVQH